MGPKRQQGLVVEREQRRPEGARQGDGVVRLGQPAEEVGEIEDLLPGEESGAGYGAAGDSVALQRLLEEVDVRQAAEQDRHVGRPRGAVFAFVPVPHGGGPAQEGGHLRGHGIGLDPSAVVVAGLVARGRLIGDRQQHQVRRLGRIIPSPGHRLHRRLELLPRVCEDMLEEGVERADERVVGAEGLAQGVDGARGRDLFVEACEVADIAPAEAVDRLLHVADEEPLGSLQQVEECDLGGVGVLMLVHHQVAEARPVGRGNLRMGGEQLCGHDLEVEIVQGHHLLLAAGVAMARVPEESPQGCEGFQGDLVVLVPAREGAELVGLVPEPAHCGLHILQVLGPVPGAPAPQVDLAARVLDPGQQVGPIPGSGVAQGRQRVAQARGQGIVPGPLEGSAQPRRPLRQFRPRLFHRRPERLTQQPPDMIRPVLLGLPRKRPVRVLDLVAPGNHQGKLDGRRVQPEFPQRQGPLIVGVGGGLQGIDAGSGQLELGLVIGEDPGGRIDGRLHGMLPQDPQAEGVDGADDGVIDLRPVMPQLLLREHLPAHALAHLGGGGVGEGDGRHLGDAVLREE